MALSFKKAVKSQSLLRLAVFGPSGAGKTYTALRIATGLGGPIAVIDSERGSASKYADRFVFDVLDLPNKTIDTYCEAIQAAGEAGYKVLIIDSLSHAWQELLDEVDRLAAHKFKGNSWSAWSEGTPKQRKLVDAILQFPGHVMATMRSKTEWSQEDDGRGKKKPVRVGLAPEQGKGIEYEFDLLMELSTEHIASLIKDRTGRFQDKLIAKPDENFGKELLAWLSEGVERRIKTVEQLVDLAKKLCDSIGNVSGTQILNGICAKHGAARVSTIAITQWDAAAKDIDDAMGVQVPAGAQVVAAGVA